MIAEAESLLTLRHQMMDAAAVLQLRVGLAFGNASAITIVWVDIQRIFVGKATVPAFYRYVSNVNVVDDLDDLLADGNSLMRISPRAENLTYLKYHSQALAVLEHGRLVRAAVIEQDILRGVHGQPDVLLSAERKDARAGDPVGL